MCIIFYNPDGAKYDRLELRNAADHNDDGAGIMWIENGKIRVHHQMIKTGDELIKLMKDFVGIPHMLHLRYATHGAPSVELCHPFRATPESADKQVWLMHNGVIGSYAKKAGRGESDTSVFSEHLQSVVSGYGSSDILFNDKYAEHIERVIDTDRMIFLRDDGAVKVLNPSRWFQNTRTNIWYSNMYSLKDIARWKTNYTNYSNYGSSTSYGSSTTRQTGWGRDYDDNFGTDSYPRGNLYSGNRGGSTTPATTTKPADKPEDKTIVMGPVSPRGGQGYRGYIMSEEVKVMSNGRKYIERKWSNGEFDYQTNVAEDSPLGFTIGGTLGIGGKSPSDSVIKSAEESAKIIEAEADRVYGPIKPTADDDTFSTRDTQPPPAPASAAEDDSIVSENDMVDDDETVEEDDVFFFRWENDIPVFSNESDADFEIDQEEFFQLLADSGISEADDMNLETAQERIVTLLIEHYHREEEEDADTLLYNYDDTKPLKELLDKDLKTRNPVPKWVADARKRWVDSPMRASKASPGLYSNSENSGDRSVITSETVVVPGNIIPSWE
jgi:predicted glutamine amidotransferase